MAVSDREELTGPRPGLARDLGDRSTAGIPAATYCSWGASQPVSCPGCVLKETSSQLLPLRQKRATSVPAPAPPPPARPAPAPAPAISHCACASNPLRSGGTYLLQDREETPGTPGTDSRALHPPNCLEKRFPSQTAHRKRKRCLGHPPLPSSGHLGSRAAVAAEKLRQVRWAESRRGCGSQNGPHCSAPCSGVDHGEAERGGGLGEVSARSRAARGLGPARSPRRSRPQRRAGTRGTPHGGSRSLRRLLCPDLDRSVPSRTRGR